MCVCVGGGGGVVTMPCLITSVGTTSTSVRTTDTPVGTTEINISWSLMTGHYFPTRMKWFLDWQTND